VFLYDVVVDSGFGIWPARRQVHKFGAIVLLLSPTNEPQSPAEKGYTVESARANNTTMVWCRHENGERDNPIDAKDRRIFQFCWCARAITDQQPQLRLDEHFQKYTTFSQQNKKNEIPKSQEASTPNVFVYSVREVSAGCC
jgi:hypothetical protein